ncbi:dUTP diphosphatase [Shimia sp. R11_0]|uniref:dUTP diphosphatase n=1 Tax=Shimia sp. R11_0 TaxID=2821096 RepID=UPI001ADB74DD|nr:dUTP diphosphatase [Shimia sp. R11_0]MBO9478304.1 dUTP diphosphatase [Shimia sp. R11_0]
MAAVSIKLKWLAEADREVALPSYESAGAAGADVRANFPADQREGVVLAPGARALVPTGLSLEIPQGYEVQMRPRSGLALKQGLTLANSPGTIDSDYRGPLGVIVLNAGQEEIVISHGMRIAQMVVAPVVLAAFDVQEDLSATERGTGGFGSTGTA